MRGFGLGSGSGGWSGDGEGVGGGVVGRSDQCHFGVGSDREEFVGWGADPHPLPVWDWVSSWSLVLVAERGWEGLREGDVVFLLAVQPSERENGVALLTNGHRHLDFEAAAADKVGLKALRCAEVATVLDENGRVIKPDHDTHDHNEGFARPRQRRLDDLADRRREQRERRAEVAVEDLAPVLPVLLPQALVLV